MTAPSWVTGTLPASSTKTIHTGKGPLSLQPVSVDGVFWRNRDRDPFVPGGRDNIDPLTKHRVAPLPGPEEPSVPKDKG